MPWASRPLTLHIVMRLTELCTNVAYDDRLAGVWALSAGHYSVVFRESFVPWSNTVSRR